MNYNKINLVSNYLANVNDKSLYKLINKDILNESNDLEFEIFKNKELNYVNHSPNETIEYSTLTFCKFAKENIFECLLDTNNQHFYKYKLGINKYEYCDVLEELNNFGFNFKHNDIGNYEINFDNSKINNHDGMHFFPHMPIKLLLSNFKYFGESFIICINDPQLVKLKEIKEINSNDFNFKQTYITNIFDATNPIYLKSLFQYCAKDKYSFNRYLRTKRNNQQNIFNMLIDKFKKIEYAEANIDNLCNCKSIIELKNNINLNFNTFKPSKYKNTIEFLIETEKIYKNLSLSNNLDLDIFCQKLDDICPGKLNIFDEKYQIEQFRDTYGGKEFKEKFLNNLSKTGNELSDTEIKELFMPSNIINKIINKLPHRIQLNEEICNKILDYNKNNPTKQIPILLLIKDLKEFDNIKLKQLNEIIDKYMSDETEYLYDYVVKQEELDKIIDKMNSSLDKIIINNKVDNKLNKIKDIEKIR